MRKHAWSSWKKQRVHHNHDIQRTFRETKVSQTNRLVKKNHHRFTAASAYSLTPDTWLRGDSVVDSFESRKGVWRTVNDYPVLVRIFTRVVKLFHDDQESWHHSMTLFKSDSPFKGNCWSLSKRTWTRHEHQQDMKSMLVLKILLSIFGHGVQAVPWMAVSSRETRHSCPFYLYFVIFIILQPFSSEMADVAVDRQARGSTKGHQQRELKGNGSHEST